MTLNVDYMDLNIENYQKNTTQLTFAYMVMFLQPTNGIFLIIIYLNENAETGFCETVLSTQCLNKVVRSTQAQNKTVSGTQYEGGYPSTML